MTVSATFANDYMVTDQTETVTYTPANRSPAVSAFTVLYASPHAYTLKEVAASNGMFQVGDRRWTLGANQFPSGTVPQRGDSITRASGEVDMILENPTLDSFGIAWVCLTGKAR
jgi:hypothetical protein